MSQSFSAFELVQTALHLNRQLVEDDPLEALEEAFKLLSFAEDHRAELGKNRFVERVDKKIEAGIKPELSRALKGECTENYVQIGPFRPDGAEGSFKELLRARRAHLDLLKMKPKGHLKLLNAYRIHVYPLEGAPKDKPFVLGAVISKMDAIKYARLESKRRRQMDARAQRRRRRQ